jgi:hypothetical protein
MPRSDLSQFPGARRPVSNVQAMVTHVPSASGPGDYLGGSSGAYAAMLAMPGALSRS